MSNQYKRNREIMGKLSEWVIQIILHRARMSGEFDSMKDSNSADFGQKHGKPCFNKSKCKW